MASRGTFIGRVLIKVILLVIFVVMIHGVCTIQVEARLPADSAPQWAKPGNVNYPLGSARPQRV